MHAANLGRICGGCDLAEGSYNLAKAPSLRINAHPWLPRSPLCLSSVFTPTCPSKGSTLCL